MSLLKTIFPPAPEQKMMIKIIYLDGEIQFQKIMLDLFNAAKDKQILGLLLIIDNYGGRTTNYFMIHDLIKRIALAKPVVAFVSGAAMSCGYAMASAANYIVAGNLSQIGSIGVVSEKWYYKEPNVITDEQYAQIKAGLESETFRAGEFKDLFNPHRQLTPEERKYVQEDVNKAYQEFLRLVARNRSLNLDTYKTWAEGKIFLAYEALQLGLIDEIGTMLEAENKLLEFIRQQNFEVRFTELIYYAD